MFIWPAFAKMEEPVRVNRCNNIGDFRTMARRRLPGPIFNYIDGAADDEVTYRRNTEAYERGDLVPNVLAGIKSIDMSITVMGQRLNMPLFCSPTALQRLFHHARRYEMSLNKPPRKDLDPLDNEILERAFEASWEAIKRTDQ